MRKLLYLFVFILAIGLAQSQTYGQYTDEELIIPFEVNGSAASSIATCNVTLTYPNQSVVFENRTTTNRENGLFNVTANTQSLGTYEWIAFCCDAGQCDAGYGTYNVTPTGDDRGFGIFLILILSATGLIMLAHVFSMESIGFLSGLLFAITGVYSMIYGIGNLSDFYTRGVSLILLGIGMIFTITAAYDFVKFEEDEE